MKKFYIISNNLQNGVIQLTSNKKYSEIEQYLDQYSNEKLPNDVYFRVVKGKKWTDLLCYYEAASIMFFSKRIIDILSVKCDVTNLSYPIKIEDKNAPQYFVLYNKAAYELINPNYMLDDLGEPPYLYIPNEVAPTLPKIFTHINGIWNIVDEEIMVEMKKSRVTNIRFREVFSLDTTEYIEFKRLHAQQKPFLL